MTSLYRRSTLVFGLVAVLLGLAILIRTAQAGGGALGYVLGVLFVGLGAGRIYLARRR